MDSQETLCDDNPMFSLVQGSEMIGLQERTEFSNYKFMDINEHNTHFFNLQQESSLLSFDPCSFYDVGHNLGVKSIDCVRDVNKASTVDSMDECQIPDVPCLLMSTHFNTRNWTLQRIIDQINECLDSTIQNMSEKVNSKLRHKFDETICCWHCCTYSPYEYCKFDIHVYNNPSNDSSCGDANYIIEMNRLLGLSEVLCKLFKLMHESFLVSNNNIIVEQSNIVSPQCNVSVDRNVESLTLYHYVKLIEQMLQTIPNDSANSPSWEAHLQGCYWLYNMLENVKSNELLALLESSSCINALNELLYHIYRYYCNQVNVVKDVVHKNYCTCISCCNDNGYDQILFICLCIMNILADKLQNKVSVLCDMRLLIRKSIMYS